MPLFARLLLVFSLFWLPHAQAIEVVSIAEHARDGGSALAVVFSSELNPKQNFDGWIELSRTDGQPVDGAWVLGENKRSLYFPKVEPKTSYQITVRTGLPGADGSLLIESKHQEVTTRNIEAALSFGSSGSLIPVRLERSLPVISVNVNEVDIDFHRVSQDKLERVMEMAQDNSFRSFWNYQEFKQLATPVYSGRFSLDPEPNKRREFRIPLNSVEALRKPGLYLAVLRAAANYNTELSDAILFTMSDISLHLRHYGDRLDVHTGSIATGKALAGVRVRLLTAQGKVLQGDKSKAEGLVSFSGLSGKENEGARFVLASQGDNLSLLDLERPGLDLADFNIGQRPYRPTELFIYGPRDLYRPGETVILAGLLRDADGHATQAVPLKARWRNPAGEVMREFTWQPDVTGYHALNYQLPAGAMTGKWLLQVDLPGSPALEHPIRVEEFLPERMKLDFKPTASHTAPGEHLQVQVQGDYLYGAPAAGNSLSTQVEVRAFREPLAQWTGFEFGDLAETGKLPSFSLDELKLDEHGQALLDIPSQWQKTRSPLNVLLTASLFESGGRAVNRNSANLIWPQAADLIGIKPLFGKENPPENSTLGFEVILADVQGQLKGSKQLDVQLISEDRQYFWEYSEGKGWDYVYSDAEYQVESTSLTSSTDGPVRLQLPVKYGHYRLEISDAETGYRSSLRFHAGRDWYYWWQKAQVDKGEGSRPDQVVLSLDKPQYHLGETAQLTIVPPADGEALILLESDKPLWSQRIEVKKSGTKVKLPIPADQARQDLYITAVVFEPAAPDQGTAPRRSFGLTHLKLDHEARRLSLEILAPDKTRPNQSLPVRVKLGNLKPNSQTKVTLAAVDEGVLAITRFKTPDPFEGFFGPRRYDVETSDLYDQIIQTGKGQLARLKFGGDGYDEDDDPLYGTPPKSKVEIFSLFAGPVDVNAQGEAQIMLELPDFNGQARLMALAFDDHSYGSTEKSITLAAPLVAEIAMPRFLAYGDESRIALDLHNLSGQPQEIQPRLIPEGPLSIEPLAASQPISLADGEKRTLYFQAKAEAMDAAVPIRLDLQGLKEKNGSPMKLERTWTLGLRPAWPAESRREDLLLKAGKPWQPAPELFDGLIQDSLKLQIGLGRSPQLDYQAHLTNLLGYPYGCVEQTSSATLPLALATPEVQKQLGLKTDLSEKERLERVNKGMERILSMQRYNGSFGFWSLNDDEEHWLTAYATDVLLDLQRMNVAVPQQRLEQSLKRLGEYLRTSGSLPGQRYSQDAKAHTFAVKAYAGYVLARVKQAALGNLRQLYDQSAADAKAPLPLIQLGLALQLMGDTQRGEAAIAQGLRLRRPPGSYLGDYGSNLSDLGHSIRLLAANGLMLDEIPALAIELAKALKHRAYLSTQERNALFLAGLTLSLRDNTPWQASLRDAIGTSQLDVTGNWSRVLNAAALEGEISLVPTMDLYLSAISRGFAAKAPTPMSNGLQIQRSYHDAEGNPLDLDQPLAEGQFIIVRLLVSSDQNRADLLVEERLPAGLELENPNLADAATLDNVEVEGKSLLKWQEANIAKHQEYRDDRYVAALDLNGGSQTSLWYVARAVTPGFYQVPPPMVEDMYDPEARALGENPLPEMLIKPKR